ncbi:MAG: hypothetical protein ACU84H_10790 [Gammaproteobacteria bacterium]
MENIKNERELNRRRELARIEVAKAIQLERIGETQNLEREKEITKDAAFRKFYKKSETCLGPKTWHEKVACGNELMRAQAEFEKVYNK